MRVYLSLGSNLDDRHAYLRQALRALARSEGLTIRCISPVIETPAMLPSEAPPDWLLPFLNLVIEVHVEGWTPQALLKHCQHIEREVGRRPAARWAPRVLDIDLLLWGERTIREADLILPHPGLLERAFVLTPLAFIAPHLRLPQAPQHTVLHWARQHALHQPLSMGVINVTPDSFSDGGHFDSTERAVQHAEALYRAGAQVLDLGAESTRPGARPLSAESEWLRLQPVLSAIISHWRDEPLRPRISVDTYHAEVAQHALEAGVDIINDVGGLCDARMLEVAAGSHCDWVAMHHLGLPVVPGQVVQGEVLTTLQHWLDDSLERWQRHGIDPQRVLFDPGIGFGKHALQSLTLLARIEHFAQYGLRVLIGHSRKSFMKTFSSTQASERDAATLGVSLALHGAPVEVLRVHEVATHVQATLARAHIVQLRGG